MIGSINPRTTNDWAGEGTWKGTTQGLGENVGLLPLIRVQVVYMLNNYYLLTILIQNIHLLDINNKDYCLAWRHVRCVIPTELSRDPVSNWCLTTSPFLKEQTSGMFTMLNLEGLLTLQPLRVVTGGTTCDCTTVSWSSCPVIQCRLILCHLRSLPECPTHGGESAIAGPHNDNLCRNTFNTSAESSPCTQWIMALEGERDLITKGPLKVLKSWLNLEHHSITNFQCNFLTVSIIKLLLASLCWLYMLLCQLPGLFKLSFQFLVSMIGNLLTGALKFNDDGKLGSLPYSK